MAAALAAEYTMPHIEQALSRGRFSLPQLPQRHARSGGRRSRSVIGASGAGSRLSERGSGRGGSAGGACPGRSTKQQSEQDSAESGFSVPQLGQLMRGIA